MLVKLIIRPVALDPRNNSKVRKNVSRLALGEKPWWSCPPSCFCAYFSVHSTQNFGVSFEAQGNFFRPSSAGGRIRQDTQKRERERTFVEGRKEAHFSECGEKSSQQPG